MWLKQSTSVVVSFGPFLDKTDGVTLEVALVSAIDHATTGAMLSKNGGALTIRSQAVTASTYDARGDYRLTLSTTDTNTLGTLRMIFEEAATCLPVWQDFMVVPANVWDSLFGADALQVDVAQWLGTAAATPTVAGVPEVDLTHVAGATTNVAALATNVDAILTDTAVIGAAGAGLTAVPWNAAWDAEVQSEVDDALVAQRLDELLNADSDIDGLAPPTVGSVFHELLTKTAGSFTYDQTTDSLEAVRDRGDAAWITATGFALATVCTEARLAELDGANLPTDVAAVKTDTAAILIDTAEIGAAGAGLTTLATQASVNTIDDFLDTEVAAILAAVDTEVAAIKAKTDSLTFTVANVIDANLLRLNGVAASAQNLEKSASIIHQGSVTGAATTTTLIDSGLTEADTDFWKGRIIIFTSGALLGQATDITAFDPALDKLTFTALTNAPAAAVEYVIV